MTAPILDHLRSVAHDAGAATGAAMGDLSDGAVDVDRVQSVDRVVEWAPFVGGSVSTASKLRQRMKTRNLLIGLAVAATVGIVVAAIVRSKRRGARSSPVPTLVGHRDSPSGDAREPRDHVREPESVTALRG